MKRSRSTEEQIIVVVRERKAGVSTAEICRKCGISGVTFYVWKANLSGVDVSETWRLKSLEEGKAKLNRLSTDTMLDNAALKDLLGRLVTPAATGHAGAERSGTVIERFYRLNDDMCNGRIDGSIVLRSLNSPDRCFPGVTMNENGLVKDAPPDDERSHIQLVKHGGIGYLQFLRHLGRARFVRNYLEIGTRDGKSLREFNCPSIAIDPKFQVVSDVVGEKKLCLFFQMSSDEFFNRYAPSNFLGEQVHVAFLDGLHLFENLLRDFINTERHARRESIIFLHDCLPLNFEMAERKKDSGKRKNQELKNYWTGDVWKILPILQRFRPDLDITLLDATPTGLVMITNLDPTQSILSENYRAALAMGNDELNTVSSYWSFIQSSMILNSSEYVSTGRLNQMIR